MGRKTLPTDEMNLTAREHKVLGFIKKTTTEKGYPPTVREICEELGIKSTSTIHKDLSSLEKKGFIRKDPAKPRAIEIVKFNKPGPTGTLPPETGANPATGSHRDISGKGGTFTQSDLQPDAPTDASGFSNESGKSGEPFRAVETASHDSFNDVAGVPSYRTPVTNYPPNDIFDDMANISEYADVTNIPLVGQVAAGTPILAQENITEYFPVLSRYINTGSTHFMLTVKGESMIEAGIMDGDYILVRQQNAAQNGDMVVAMVDGFESEATVKTFYNEGTHIRLQPENSTMSPILVKDVKILGIVRGVFRYFH